MQSTRSAERQQWSAHGHPTSSWHWHPLSRFAVFLDNVPTTPKLLQAWERGEPSENITLPTAAEETELFSEEEIR